MARPAVTMGFQALKVNLWAQSSAPICFRVHNNLFSGEGPMTMHAFPISFFTEVTPQAFHREQPFTCWPLKSQVSFIVVEKSKQRFHWGENRTVLWKLMGKTYPARWWNKSKSWKSLKNKLKNIRTADEIKLYPGSLSNRKSSTIVTSPFAN